MSYPEEKLVIVKSKIRYNQEWITLNTTIWDRVDTQEEHDAERIRLREKYDKLMY